MKYVVNALKASGIVLGLCAALVIAGLMYAVATGPAHAGATRVQTPPPPPNPVTVEAQQAVTKKFNTFIACLGDRLFDVRADIKKMEDAKDAAGWAAARRQLSVFNDNAKIVDDELARLNPKYGCSAS